MAEAVLDAAGMAVTNRVRWSEMSTSGSSRIIFTAIFARFSAQKYCGNGRMSIGCENPDMSKYALMKDTPSKKIIIYTDGGSRGNPGPAAIGVVIVDTFGNRKKEYGKAIGVRTNNEAEYEAVCFSLAKAKALVGGKEAKESVVELYVDSELVARQLGGRYKVEEERLFPYFMKVWNARIDFKLISFHHVPREKNREADRLVNEALDQEAHTLFQ